MICATCVLLAVVAAADPAEFKTVATGRFCHSVAFSPDGEWIVSLRKEDPVPPAGEATYHIDLWNVSDIDAFAGSATETPRPAATTELKDCHSAVTACFSKDGEVVVLARESEMNGHRVQLSRGSKAVTPEEAKQAKDSGRRVTRFQRPVTLFLGRDDLVERRRWVDDHLTSNGYLGASIVWFPAGRTAVHFTGHDGVRLLDEATGEEYERLNFELDRPGDSWGGRGDAQITPVDARSCVVAACSRQRHAVWKVTADRKVTKLAEVKHPGLAGPVAVSPLGNVLAVKANSSDYRWARNPPANANRDGDGWLELWDVETRNARPKVLADELWIQDAKFSPDGKRLAALGGGSFFVEPATSPKTGQPGQMGRFSGDIILWDVATGRQLLRRLLGKTCPSFIRFSPDGRRLLTVEEIDEENWGSRIRLWDLDRMLKAEGLSPSRTRL
jgi:WD40 repeat protein